MGNNSTGTLTNAYATGTVSGKIAVGGLVGRNYDSTLTNVYATGTVSGGDYVGGLVGWNTGTGTLTDAYATGTVSGSNAVGGLIGYNTGTLTDVYATGTVSGGNYVGGLIGYNTGTPTDAYATGNVSGSYDVGGLIGGNIKGTVTDAYATGTVSGATNVGGLVGSNTGTVTDGYWDTTTTGQGTNQGYGSQSGTVNFTTNSGGTTTSGTGGLSNTNMMAQSSFAGFDFTNTWVIYDGHTAPLLRSFMTPLTITGGSNGAVSATYTGSAITLGDLSVTYSVNGATATTTAPAANLYGSNAPYGSNAVNAGTYSYQSGSLWSDQQGYIITANLGTLTITPKALTVTLTGDPTKVYDGTASATLTAGNYAVTGFVSGQSATVNSNAPATGTYASANAGTNDTVTAASMLASSDLTASSNTDLSNYTLPTAPASGQGTITPKALTVTLTGDPTKVYDGTASATLTAGNYAVTGFVSGQSATVNSNAPATGTYASANAGTNDTVTAASMLASSDLTASSNTDLSNYTLPTAPASGQGTIDPAPLTITANSETMTYGGSLPSLGVSYNGFVNGDSPSSLTTAPTVVSGTLPTANAGTYAGTLTASGAVDSNYTMTYVPGTLTIDPAPLTITANSETMTYGGSLPSLGVSYNGFVNGDSPSSLTTAPTVVSGTLPTANAGTYAGTLTASGAVDSNYTMTYVPGTLTIDPKSLTVTGVTATNKVYDGTTTDNLSLIGAALNGVVGTDSVSLGSGSNAGTFASADVGTHISVTAHLVLTGSAAGNYTLTEPIGLAASILPAANGMDSAAVEHQMQDGYVTSAADPALSLMPLRFLQVLLPGQPMHVTLTTVDGGVSPPGLACYGAASFSPFGFSASGGICGAGDTRE